MILGIALASLTFFVWADTAQARIGWGGFGGYYGGGWNRGFTGYYGGWGNNYYSPYYGGYSGWGYPSYGYGSYGRGYYPSYGYSNYGYYPNMANYVTPGYQYGYSPNYSYGSTYSSTPSLSYGTDVTQSQNISPASYQSFYSGPSNDVVRLRVLVPTPDTRVWIEDSPTKETGVDRIFESPRLEPGRTYTYHLKARWMENGREVTKDREVKVEPGKETTVRFSSTDTEGNQNTNLNNNQNQNTNPGNLNNDRTTNPNNLNNPNTDPSNLNNRNTNPSDRNTNPNRNPIP